MYNSMQNIKQQNAFTTHFIEILQLPLSIKAFTSDYKKKSLYKSTMPPAMQAFSVDIKISRLLNRVTIK